MLQGSTAMPRNVRLRRAQVKFQFLLKTFAVRNKHSAGVGLSVMIYGRRRREVRFMFRSTRAKRTIISHLRWRPLDEKKITVDSQWRPSNFVPNYKKITIKKQRVRNVNNDSAASRLATSVEISGKCCKLSKSSNGIVRR